MQVLHDLLAAVQAEARWLSILGQSFDALGALVIVYSVIISRRGAARLSGVIPPEESGVPLWSQDTSDGYERPPRSMTDRLRQSRFAVAGGMMLFVGFVLQVWGTWPR